MDVVQQKQDKQLQHQTQEQQHIREDQQEVPPQRPRQQTDGNPGGIPLPTMSQTREELQNILMDKEGVVRQRIFKIA